MFGEPIYPLLCLIVLVVVAAISAVVFSRRRKGSVEFVGGIEIMHECGWEVTLRYRNGLYISPFLNREGKNFVSPTERGIRQSLRSCLKKDKFRDQRDKLESQGIINRLPEAAERSRS